MHALAGTGTEASRAKELSVDDVILHTILVEPPVALGTLHIDEVRIVGLAAETV